MRNLIIVLIFYTTLWSAQRTVWSGFRYRGNQLDDQTITAINSAFQDELVNSGFFEIVDREYLDNKLLERLEDNQNYSHQEINRLLKQAAGTDYLIWGEASALPDRFIFSASYINTSNGGQIASVQQEYAVNPGFLPFYIKELAGELTTKIKNLQPTGFNRKLLKANRQKFNRNDKSFYLDKYEVTNFYFQAFIDATGHVTEAERNGYSWLFRDDHWQKVKGTDWHHPGGPATTITGAENLPVIHISHSDATAYCKWAGSRLPAVSEWETAAANGKGTVYPYGNRFDDLRGNFNAGETGWPCKTGSFPAENGGLYDLSGNISEWTADSVKIKGLVYYFIKGGSWLSLPNETKTSHTNYQPPAACFPYLGFRCAWDE